MPSRRRAEWSPLLLCWWIVKREGATRLRPWAIRLSRCSRRRTCSETMPNHINQRVLRLRELVQQGLHEENLDRAVRECNSLAQDSPRVLLFFTLKNIFGELAEALESGAIEVSRFEEFVRGISE